MRQIEDILQRIPRIEAVRQLGVKAVPIKMHFCCGGNHWYVVGFDGKDTFLGFVRLNSIETTEFCYFSYSHLRVAQGSMIMKDMETDENVEIPIYIEWDSNWRPTSDARWIDPSIFPVHDMLRGGVTVWMDGPDSISSVQ